MTAPVAADDAKAIKPRVADDTLAPGPVVEASFISHPSLDGVRLERLRAGNGGAALFIVPGLEADPNELVEVASAVVGPYDVYAVAPLPEDAQRRPLVTVERMAELMLRSIRHVQPSGPYRLAGYSFGGLLALEMAQQLRAAGEAVDPLFLVEPIYDERYWPRGIWLRALARRTGRQLLRIVRMRPAEAVGELRIRGVRLIQRAMRRNAAAPDPLRVDTSAEATMRGRALTAISSYRPRFFDGRVTLIASTIDRHFGCDAIRLWAGCAAHIEVARVDADHVSIMHEPASAAVANVIDHRLALTRTDWAGIRPRPGFERPMILTTVRWFSAARLAHALTESGFSVSACRPRAHALEFVDGLVSDSRLNRLLPLRSLSAAIRRVMPDIILPDDERSLVLLRRLHARVRNADPAMAALIARSLGPIADWPLIRSRATLADEAAKLDVPAPATRVIDNADALSAWAAEHGFPVVLKTDGSWGGRGVAIARDASQLRRAWRTISKPPRLARALKRAFFNSDSGLLAAWAGRVRPVVNAQQFVQGREAIATVACDGGEVLALVCLEVVAASEARGPAAVVRIIENPAMAEAARRLVARYRLSGFCGFDFIVTDQGEAELLEMNSRVTPTCYLLVEGDYERGRTIELFPPNVLRGGENRADVLHVPVRAPKLVRVGERSAVRQKSVVARMGRQVAKKLSRSPY